ncbi:MAG: hypothetical protein JKX92_03330 [Porticoccaceae bacterium]|nr:hypothetical protein [Porticoccaceae bacterium]
MRHINNRHLRRLVDVSQAENAKAECDGLDAVARGGYIDANGDSWSYLKPGLWQLGSMKCWYSEALLQEQEGHVEHFRPKKKLHGAKHGGYWWRAFDWTNMRLSHPTSNIRRRDYLTGEVAGKGSYFPVKNEQFRAADEASEINEQPVLLDPTVATDCKLLAFDSSNGRPVPRYSEEQDCWKFKRADQSINYYHLDEGTWNFKRKDLMDEVAVLCDRILSSDEQDIEELIEELLAYSEPHEEFISASEQVILEKGLLEKIA